MKIFHLDTILGTITVKNEILVILERFLEAKIFEKRPSIFTKNDQRINNDNNITLNKSVKKTPFCHVSLPLEKMIFFILLKKRSAYKIFEILKHFF